MKYSRDGWTNIREHLKRKLSYFMFIIIGLFTVTATKDYLSWNSAKNQAYIFLREKGVSIDEMDAGYEYNGMYNYSRELKWWPVTDDLYVISFGKIDGYEIYAKFEYFRIMQMKKDYIYVLKRIDNKSCKIKQNRKECPPPQGFLGHTFRGYYPPKGVKVCPRTQGYRTKLRWPRSELPVQWRRTHEGQDTNIQLRRANGGGFHAG